MSEKTQNDWDVVVDALSFNDVPQDVRDAFDRLREFSAFTISNLNARITELETELQLRAPEGGWPVPADTTHWPDMRKHSWDEGN